MHLGIIVVSDMILQRISFLNAIILVCTLSCERLVTGHREVPTHCIYMPSLETQRSERTPKTNNFYVPV